MKFDRTKHKNIELIAHWALFCAFIPWGNIFFMTHVWVKPAVGTFEWWEFYDVFNVMFICVFTALISFGVWGVWWKFNVDAKNWEKCDKCGQYHRIN